MYSDTSSIFWLCAILFIANTHAIPKKSTLSACNSDEIGIGTSEKFTTTDGGTSFQGEGYHGAIYSPNCKILDISSSSNPFEGGWDDFYGVSNTKNGIAGIFPIEVRTPDGIYNKCKSLDVDRNCDSGDKDYNLLSRVTHCCKYSGPNDEVQKRDIETGIAKTICNPNEVGVGRILVNEYTSPSTIESNGHQGAIFAHDCQILDLSQYTSPWEGGWHRHFNVLERNDDTGSFPTEVQTPNGIYQSCRVLSDDSDCSGPGRDYYLEASISHCCKHSGPNNEVQKRQVDKSEAVTICEPKEVGVGRIHIDQQSSDSSVVANGFQGAIFAHDCQVLDLSRYTTPWTGGWGQYFNVFHTVSDQGPFPAEVRTPGGIYQRCMKLPEGSNCDGSGHDYFLEAPITHCCEYIKPNPDAIQKAASIENIENDNTEIDGSLPTDSVDT